MIVQAEIDPSLATQRLATQRPDKKIDYSFITTEEGKVILDLSGADEHFQATILPEEIKNLIRVAKRLTYTMPNSRLVVRGVPQTAFLYGALQRTDLVDFE